MFCAVAVFVVRVEGRVVRPWVGAVSLCTARRRLNLWTPVRRMLKQWLLCSCAFANKLHLFSCYFLGSLMYRESRAFLFSSKMLWVDRCGWFTERGCLDGILERFVH